LKHSKTPPNLKNSLKPYTLEIALKSPSFEISSEKPQTLQIYPKLSQTLKSAQENPKPYQYSKTPSNPTNKPKKTLKL
jgi:LPS O-antigen subunit length determinant protein (WzzB/FepE family)